MQSKFHARFSLEFDGISISSIKNRNAVPLNSPGLIRLGGSTLGSIPPQSANPVRIGEKPGSSNEGVQPIYPTLSGLDGLFFLLPRVGSPIAILPWAVKLNRFAVPSKYLGYY
jgi:hypothetical protein